MVLCAYERDLISMALTEYEICTIYKYLAQGLALCTEILRCQIFKAYTRKTKKDMSIIRKIRLPYVLRNYIFSALKIFIQKLAIPLL